VAAVPGLLRRARRPTPGFDAVFPLDDLVPAPERYTILYQGMHCEDETGNDYFAAFTVERDPLAPYPEPVVE
jgi:hypothetical protein